MTLTQDFGSNLTVSFVISEFCKVKTTQATHLDSNSVLSCLLRSPLLRDEN